MRKIIISGLFICLNIWSFAQSNDVEVFKVKKELIIREGSSFTWQNKDQAIYLGSIKQIPGNRGIPSYEQRSELLNALLNDFLSGAISKAKELNRDSIFNDGFLLDRGITAIGVQYQENEPYKVYVGQRVVQSTSYNKDNVPQTMKELVQSIHEKYLSKLYGEQLKFETKIVECKNAIPHRHSQHISYIINGDGKRFHMTLFTLEGFYDDSLEAILRKTNYNSLDDFLVQMSSGITPFRWWYIDTGQRKDSQYLHLNNTFKIDPSELAKLLNGNEVKVEVEKDSTEVSNLETAKNRGQYGFIADYLFRIIKQANTPGEIMYLNPGDPIFVQDSVLDMYINGSFTNISKSPIDSKYKDLLLPEIVSRHFNKKSTKLKGKITLHGVETISYEFEKEKSTVIAHHDPIKKSTSFYYVLGWDKVSEKNKLIDLLISQDIPQREDVLIKQIDEKLVLITPVLDDYKIDLWEAENRKRHHLADLPKLLSPVQLDLALKSILNRYEEEPENMNIIIHDYDLYQSNQLVVSYADYSKRLYLYQHSKDIDQVVLSGSIYKSSWQAFYNSIFDMISFSGEYDLLTVDNDPVLLDQKNTVWIEFKNKLVELISFKEKQKPGFLRNKLIRQTKKEYPSQLKKATLLHWAGNDAYAAIEYPAGDNGQIIAGQPNPEHMIKIKGLKNFSTNEDLINALIKKYNEIDKVLEIELKGDATDKAWLINIGGEFYISGRDLNQIYWLGPGFIDSEINQKEFLAHISGLIKANSIEPEISKMKAEANLWIYGLTNENDQLRIFNASSAHKHQVYKGTIAQDYYFSNKDFLLSLQSLFIDYDTISTNKIDGVLISDSKDRIAIWDNNLKKMHQPSNKFPKYSNSQRTRLLSKLTSLYQVNNQYTIEPNNNISTKNTYGLYDPEKNKWYYLPNIKNPNFIEVNGINENLPMKLVDVLTNKVSGKKTFEYTKVNDSHFFLESSNILFKSYTLDDNYLWKNLDTIGNINKLYLPDLYYAVLSFVSQNHTVKKLEGFKEFDLEKNDVAIWKNLSNWQTITTNKLQDTSYSFLQNQHIHFLDNNKMLDAYFNECAKLKDPGSLIVFNKELLITSFYLPENQLWYMQMDEAIKTLKVNKTVFDKIIADQTVKQGLIIKALQSYYSSDPKIEFGKNGFYFIHNGKLIFNIIKKPNTVYYDNISSIKSKINTNINNQTYMAKFNTTNTDEILIQLIHCMCIKGKHPRLHYQYDENIIFPKPCNLE